MRLVGVMALVVATASTASAQSAYVGASFIGDFILVSGSTFPGGSGNGETFGGALRAGMSLGEHWGVELEFARTGEVDAMPGVYLAGASFGFGAENVGAPNTVVSSSIFPAPQFDSERQLSTISTLVWWSHEVSQRVSLVYLGGVAFTRSATEFRVSYPEIPPIPPIPRIPVGGAIFPQRIIEQEFTAYDADVAVGFEGRIGMTEHIRLIPGIRLQTAVGGWAIRPGIGLQWMF